MNRGEALEAFEKLDRREPKALWVRCLYCADFWCQKHGTHAFECPCPPIDELDFDPYAEGR